MKINIQDDEDDDLDIGSTLAMSQSNNKEKDEPNKRLDVVKQIDDLKEGDEIYYNDVLCTVKTIIESTQSPKLIIEYQNGVRDVVLYNKSKYTKATYSLKNKQKYVQTENKRQQFQLSTPLSELVDLNIITEKQLHQCRKKD